MKVVFKKQEDFTLTLYSRRFSAESIKALIATVENGSLHMGKQVAIFEKHFADYCGVKHAVAVSSGAAGLHLAMMAAGIGHKEEVIVSPLAPVAGPNAVFHQGAVNIFADIDAATGNIDPLKIAPKINANTKAIVLHHYAGQPCDLQPVLAMVKDKDITIIVDATSALGACYQGRPVAAWGDMVIFDFGPGGHIYTGDGGMITTDSDELEQWLRMFRDEGFVSSPDLLTKDEGDWHFEMQDLGYAYRMTELQAALGLSQLKQLDQILVGRQAVTKQYQAAFSDLAQVKLPLVLPGTIPANGFYALQLNIEHLAPNRRKIFTALRSAGIAVDVRYYPVFLQPYYLWAGHPEACTLEGSRAPKAEEFYQRVLILPVEEQFLQDKNNLERSILERSIIKVKSEIMKY